MLKVPAYQYYEDLRVTVYQDDTMFWKFYLMPDYVSPRRTDTGDPVFLLIKYAFSDQDREANPNLPRGGGYLAFDVELKTNEADEGELRLRLQELVDAEWNNLKAFAEQAGEPVQGMALSSWYNRKGRSGSSSLSVHDVKLGLAPDRPEAPPGDRPPLVQLSFPEWTKGTFAVIAPTSANLVTHAVVEGPLSLTGANNAAVAMELTEAGATFMQRTLLERDGSGGSDLLPLAVRMDLWFMARLPPTELLVQADRRSVSMALDSLDQDYNGHDCSEDEMSQYQTHLDMAVESNLITVKFDTGMLPMESDLALEIRKTAMDMVQNLLKDEFFEEDPDAADPADDDGDEENPDEGMDVYRLKTTASSRSGSIHYKETLTSIIETEKHPQGTLQSFFDGVSADKMRNFVREVDLNDSFFMTLGLEVNCYADWDRNPIAFVEVQVRYDGRDENNDLVEKNETFTFSKAKTTASWNPSLIGAKREYAYRWRLAYTGKEPGEFTGWERDRTPTLNLSIPDSGRLDLRLLAGAIDFAQTVDHVQVSVTYEDRSNDVNKETMTFKLTNGQLEQHYVRTLFADWDKPVTVKSSFVLKDGQIITTPEVQTVDRTVMVNAPLYDKLDVGMVPFGAGWENVQQCIINLVYDDPANNYHVDQAFNIKSAAEFKSWAVVLQDRALRKFRYKISTSFKNGDFEATPDFLEADGDQTVPIIVNNQPRLDVKIMPNTVDFGATPVVTCTLRYDDPAANIHQVKTFAFDEASKVPVSWGFTIADSTRKTYRHEMRFHTFQGTLDRDEVATDETVLVLPRVATPQVKCQFSAKLINFTDTPIVVIDIDYVDPVGGRDMSETFTVEAPTDAPLFQHQITEDSPTDFTFRLTYHKADGTVFVADPVTTNDKRIVVPRYMPVPAPVT